MDESWILLDDDTGLHVGWYFWLRVLDEANRSARYGNPFGLLLLDAEAKQTSQAGRAVADALARVPGAIRSSDLAGVLGPGRAGVILPHQDAASAEAATRRIVNDLEKRGGGVVWSARLLCYPGDGAEISNLLTEGTTERRPKESRPTLEQPA